MDNDYGNYVGMFYSYMGDEIEFTFAWLVSLAKLFYDEPAFVFMCYALLSVPLRAWGIVRNTELWFLSALIWMANYYMLHDMTQIRVAVASSIFLISLPFLKDGRRLPYLGCIAAAACFHISALILAPLAIFGNKPLGRFWNYAIIALPLAGILLGLMGLNFATALPIPYIEEKLKAYEEMRDSGVLGATINVFNILHLLKIAILYFLLWKQDVITRKIDNLPLLLKLMSISLFCFGAFSFLPILSFRFSELIGVVEIILIPYLVLTVKSEYYGKALVVAFACTYFAFNLFVTKLLISV